MYVYTSLDTVDAILVSLGILFSVIGSFMFILAAYREVLLWGCAVLFFAPVAAPVFMIMHWQIAKKSFAIALLGYLLSAIALSRTGQIELPLPTVGELKEASTPGSQLNRTGI